MRQIYGIDLSKEKFDVNFLGPNNMPKGLIVKNNVEGIAEFLEYLPQDAILCVEHTGVYGELLTFICCAMNIPISLSTGYEIKHSLGLQKGKSDKMDAKRIREYGERFFDKLKFACYPNENLREVKELYTLRAQLVKKRKMLITQDKGKKHLPYNSIKAHEVTMNIVKTLNKEVERLEVEIAAIIISDQELGDNYRLIMGIKGIGQVTASDLIVKTGNFKEIGTARKAASFAGICPFPNASGKMVKKSRVSKMGDKELKTLLYLCSVVAVNVNPEYKLYYLRKKQEGKPYFVCMNNVANKLLRTIYSIVKTRKEYSLGHITYDPRVVEKVA